MRSDTENAQEVEQIQTSQRTSCQRALPALRTLRGVTFCADRRLPKSCPGEMLSVTLPWGKPWNGRVFEVRSDTENAQEV